MSRTEERNIFLVVDKKPDGSTTMSARWQANGHETGVWVQYGAEISHKEAFSMLMQGVWEALQDPDSYNIEQYSREGNITPPYWDGLR